MNLFSKSPTFFPVKFSAYMVSDDKDGVGERCYLYKLLCDMQACIIILSIGLYMLRDHAS